MGARGMADSVPLCAWTGSARLLQQGCLQKSRGGPTITKTSGTGARDQAPRDRIRAGKKKQVGTQKGTTETFQGQRLIYGDNLDQRKY